MRSIAILLLILSACQTKPEAVNKISTSQPDTVIATVDLQQELAGSAYRQRATGYFLVIDGDSSLYRPAFTESNEGRVSLMLGLHPLLPYDEQLAQLETLLPHAARSYALDSLHSVFMGRLVQTGDLAIDITKEYLVEFNGYGSTATTEYSVIADFLAHSRLGRDLDQVFSPYRLKVSGTSIEKVFFTEPYLSGPIDSARYAAGEIPEKVLDCMTWVIMENTLVP